LKSIIDFINQYYIEILNNLSRHLYLVFVSVAIGILIAVPLGIILSRHKKMAEPIITGVSIFQTIPGLVLLGFSMMIFGIGVNPAIVVLTLYSLLPILRNTYTGINNVDVSLKDAAKGIGMTKNQILFKVELPLAASTIISGIRISTIYIISWATLAALIGAGGLGDLIWTGLATYSKDYILAGTIPAALLALVVSYLLEILQKLATPKGLKVKR
jgi:osmoprotectant transport system permease protein